MMMKAAPNLIRSVRSRRLHGITSGARRGSAGIALFVLLAVLVGAQESETNAGLSRAIAADLVVESTRLRQAGDFESARDLARRALTIDPQFGPAIVRFASFLVGDQRATRFQIDLLEAALAEPLPPELRAEATTMLSDTYLRTGASERARELLEAEILRGSEDNLVLLWRDLPRSSVYPPGTAETTAGSGSGPGEMELMFLRSLLDGASRWRVSMFLRELRHRYPRNLSVAAIDWLRYDRLSLEALEWIDGLQIRDPTPLTEEEREDYIRTICRFVEIAPSPQLQHELAYLYYSLGGEDSVPYALVNNDGPIDETDPVWCRAEARFVAALAAGDKIVIEQAALVGREIGIAEDTQLLRLDADRNGFAEERYRFSGDGLVTWMSDRNEDGLVELALTVDQSGLNLWYRSESTVDVYRYRRYPRLTEIQRVAIAGPPQVFDGMEPQERVESIRRWQPPEPIDLSLPLSVRHLDGQTTELEEGMRSRGISTQWINPTDRLISMGPPARSYDRQLSAAVPVQDELTTQLRELGLIR